MTHYKKLFSTIGVTGLAFVVSYLITMFLTPYITQNIGTEAYGFVKLAKDIAQYATYITIALNSFAVRFISVSYHQQDYKKANVYFSSVFFGDIALGTIIFLIAGVAITHLEKIFQIPTALVHDVKILFVIVFVRFLLQTIFSVYESGALTVNKLIITNSFRLIASFAEAGMMLLLFVTCGANIIYVGVALIASSVIELLGEIYVTRHYTHELYPQTKLFRFQAVKELVGNGIWSTFNSLGGLLNNGLDMLICNLCIGAYAMGQLAIASIIPSIYNGLQIMIAQPFQPIYLKKYAENDIEGIKKEMQFAIKISSMAGNVMFAGIVALGLSYYNLWIPEQDTKLIADLTIISAIAGVSAMLVTPIQYIATLKLRKKIPCLVTFAGGILNVISMIVLLKVFGCDVKAVVWTTAVIMTAINLLFTPLYASRIIGWKPKDLYVPILRCLASLGIMLIVFKCLATIWSPASWVQFIAIAALDVCLGAIIHILIVFSHEQKIRIKNKIFRRKKYGV